MVGATGLIGRRLAAALAARGDGVVAVSRGGTLVEGATPVAWMPGEAPLPAAARDGVDAIVNLAGAPPRPWGWTAAFKRGFRESRVKSAAGVVAALGDGGPSVLVNASAVGYYGARGDEALDESAGPGPSDDFLAQTCVLWEQAARAGAERGARVAIVRSGVVLAREGGGLPKLALPTRLFVGGPLGGGRQWLSWIHIEDEVGLILLALERPELAGPVNLTAPSPVRQRDFARTLGAVLGRPSFLPTPAAPLRLAMGEAATIALDGQRAVPAAALGVGYHFRFPELRPALSDLLG